MEIDTTQLDSRDNYHLLVHCVVPRPIAWITTVSETGTRNLAPFSYFAPITSAPPLLMVSVGKRRGELKDTARNLLAQGEGIVHIPDRGLAAPMVQSSAELPEEVDEIELTGLDTVPGTKVDAPRLTAAAVALECRLHRHLELGDKKADVLFLEVVYAHLKDSVLEGRLPDPARLTAVGRLGGDGYSDTAEPFAIKRP